MFLKKLLVFAKVCGRKNQISARKYVRLAGRPYLLGSDGAGFPKALNGPRENYPFVIQANDQNVNHRTSPEDCALAVK